MIQWKYDLALPHFFSLFQGRYQLLKLLIDVESHHPIDVHQAWAVIMLF
jgi:hypothetical protein